MRAQDTFIYHLVEKLWESKHTVKSRFAIKFRCIIFIFISDIFIKLIFSTKKVQYW